MDSPTQTRSAQLFGTFTRGLVRVLSGPAQGLKAELGREPLLVGSGAEAQLRLADPLVSRRHCELRWGRWAAWSLISTAATAPGSAPRG